MGEADYYGSLFVGSNYRYSKVVYDTMSKRTAVVLELASGSENVNTYDLADSRTAAPVYDDKFRKQQFQKNIDLGQVQLIGKGYRDNMCLLQQSKARTDATGRICVRSMPFVAVDTIIGDMESNGVLGLAPGDSEDSYVQQLFNQG
mmetsp:Transcript_9682/g.16288  ORF Transcript_9682/g.16288 Transcript_9682/m.16288 type:complete len:146 (-) Transcript_9682:1086-1523(-)